MPPPTLAEVIFPSQANHSLSRILGDLKRANLSITNRLLSICCDAAFVDEVAAGLSGLPLVANERCGSWYIDPARKAGSAYFKSTDGHTGQWKFSTRRLNLHLLGLIGEADGCIIVDSTRRGKRMPDALSKTIPTWCAVLNRVLFPSSSHRHHDHPMSHRTLSVPPSAVSPSEASQITALLPSFVTSFLALEIDLAPLRERLRGKPLRPVWVAQGDDLALLSEEVRRVRQAGCHPVVCCTSSRRVVAGAEMSEGGYIQGAADDTENWALGLTAAVFWRSREELLAAGEGELPGLIAELVARGEAERSAGESGGSGGVGEVRQVVSGVFVGTPTVAAERWVEDGACVVALVPKVTEQSRWVKGPAYLEAGLGKSKAASRLLRDALPQVCEFVMQYLKKTRDSPSERRVVVLCESGKDLSVGVALAVCCWCFDDSGSVRPDGREVSFNKAAIRVRLGQIVTALPEANPSRATLQSVNSFLMDWRK